MVIRRLLTVAPAVAALLASACTTSARPATAPATSTATPTSAASRSAGPAASHRPSQAGRRRGRPGRITLAFAGDVHFTGRTARLLRHPATAFGPIARVLRAADFTAVNLETAVTSRGRPQPKTYHFRATPTTFTALRDAGIDLVTMANNHVLDYGRTGLRDTLAAARAARFPYVGIGTSAARAWAPYVTTIKGRKIAIIGVSQVAELASSWVATRTRPGEANAINVRATLAAVRAARRLARTVIVFMHWGTEGQACPDPYQRALAPRLAAAGASIIIGAHAHVLQGSGWLGRTFVAYGMGNFLWWEHSYSVATGVLELTLPARGPLTARLRPATVSGTGRPVLDRGAAARRALASYAGLRACTGLAARPPGHASPRSRRTSRNPATASWRSGPRSSTTTIRVLAQ